MRNEYPLYLNGAWTPQTDGCVREDIEPATGKPPLHSAPRRPCRCGDRACERRGGVPRLGRGDGGRARARAAARRGRYGEPRGGISGAARPRRRQGAAHRARRICRQRESLPRRGGRMPPPHDGDVPGGQAGADVSGRAPSARRHSGEYSRSTIR